MTDGKPRDKGSEETTIEAPDQAVVAAWVRDAEELIDAMPGKERFDKTAMAFGVVLAASKLTGEESFRAFLVHVVTTKGIPKATLTYPLPNGEDQVIEATLPPRKYM